MFSLVNLGFPSVLSGFPQISYLAYQKPIDRALDLLVIMFILTRAHYVDTRTDALYDSIDWHESHLSQVKVLMELYSRESQEFYVIVQFTSVLDQN